MTTISMKPVSRTLAAKPLTNSYTETVAILIAGDIPVLMDDNEREVDRTLHVFHYEMDANISIRQLHCVNATS